MIAHFPRINVQQGVANSSNKFKHSYFFIHLSHMKLLIFNQIMSILDLLPFQHGFLQVKHFQFSEYCAIFVLASVLIDLKSQKSLIKAKNKTPTFSQGSELVQQIFNNILTNAKNDYITENRRLYSIRNSLINTDSQSPFGSLIGQGKKENRKLQSLLKMKENLSGLDFESFVFQAAQELSKNIENNLSLRMKYPTQTDKFYSSEEFIHETLNMMDQKLEQTQQPPQQILKVLINSKILVPVLKSLEHPNPDINMAAINVFDSVLLDMNQEIEQAQNNAERDNDKGISEAFPLFFRMCIWLTENGLIESMFAILNRLDQQKIEEYAACGKILKCFDYILDFCDSSYTVFVKETKIISFISNRILPNFTVSHRTIDDNKFVASDLLLALLQTPEVEVGISAVRQLFQTCGVEVLIATISTYETKLPTEIDERQFLSNLFDCLNVLVVSVRQSRPQIHQMRGSYLLVTYICNKTEFAVTALKIIANSLDNEFQQQFLCSICDEIVNDGSLKYLFPILKAQGVKGKDEDEQREINENILNILYFLIRNSEGVARDRILFKFIQKRYEKLERVFQMRIQNTMESDKSKQIEVSPQDYLKMIKQDNLALIQLCDKIIITLWASSNKLREKIIVFLGLYALPPKNISIVIERLYKFIDEGQQKNYLQKMLSTSIRQINEIKQ